MQLLTTSAIDAAPPPVAERRWAPLARKLRRCLSVSVLTSGISAVVLVTLSGPLAVTPWIANAVATAVGTVPSYLLNRRWVWGLSGRGSAWREVAPFWAMSFTGLVVSTLAVDRAATLTTHLAITGIVRSAVLVTANVGSFGLLWIAQFVILDRWLFAHRGARRDGAA